MDELAQKHEVELAMIYDHWLGENVPADWVSVGTLLTRGPNVGMAASTVHFYATTEAAAGRVRPSLEAFRRTLPAGTRFVFAGETSN